MPKVLNRRSMKKTYAKDKAWDRAIYVGRPTKWGNPFEIGRDGNRGEVLLKYMAYMKAHPEICEEVKAELKGKHLVCWCAPEPCHADLLLEIANG